MSNYPVQGGPALPVHVVNGLSDTGYPIQGGGSVPVFITNSDFVVTGVLAQGDIIVRNGANQWTNFPVGAPLQVLQVNAGVTALEWVASPQSVLTTTGDLLYASAANTLARLADVAVGSVLISGGVGAAPSWSATPTITSLTSPTILGGTGTTSDLTLQTTSGVGATGADMHFLVGNNGATEAMTILNSGNVGIGTTSPSRILDVAGGQGWESSGTEIAYLNPTSTGADVKLFGSGGTESVRIDARSGGSTYFNSGGNVGIGTTVFGASAAGVFALGGTSVEPTTSVDLVHVYGFDRAIGARALTVFQEAAVEAIGVAVADNLIPVRWNGVNYKLFAIAA